MRASLLAIALLPLGCTTRHPDTLTISGAPLTDEQRAWIPEALAATADCLRELGHRDLEPVYSVRVMPTCCFPVRGYSKPQRGTVDGDTVVTGRDLRTLRHEATVVMLDGYHSHAPDSPTILCEHAGRNAPAFKCEEP